MEGCELIFMKSSGRELKNSEIHTKSVKIKQKVAGNRSFGQFRRGRYSKKKGVSRDFRKNERPLAVYDREMRISRRT